MRASVLRLALVAFLASGCRPARPEPAAPAQSPAPVLSADLYQLRVLNESFREDRSRSAAIGVPTPGPTTVASLEVGELAAGDVLLVTSAYTLESRIDDTNIGIATTIYLADHPGGYREGDREILGFGSHNITNHGDVYPHYGTPSFSGIYRVAAGDEQFRYINLVSWIGTDDTRQAGKLVRLLRAQLDVLHFAWVAGRGHAAR